MKSSMRAFGIGIFIAGAALASNEYFFSDDDALETKELEKQVQLYEKQIADLTAQLEHKNTSKEDTSSEQNNNSSTEVETETTKESSEPESSSSTNVVKATIYIYENVSIYTIGQQAEDLGIVKNGRELELFLAKPEYSRSIQKGAFDLRSDMTIEEIAKTLTGKN